MSSIIIFGISILAGIDFAKSATGNIHPDVGKSIKELVPKYGYPFEEHQVTTEDGYVLELHRIPNGKVNLHNQARPAVLLLHGMLCTSDSWINMGPKISLGYLLADSGYDVWLGNHRGTTWSRKHIRLDPEEDGEAFWNFSFHEAGIYDDKAFIDYILKVTREESLFYIGYSQGTTTFFTLTSVLPEYNSKIRLMVGLAPVAFNQNLKSPLIRLFIPFKDKMWAIVQKYGMYGVMKHSPLITLAGQVLCSDDAPTQFLCVIAISLLGGFNIPQTNKSMIPVILSSAPSGESWKQFSHQLQGFESGDFKQYDYGKDGNVKKYGQAHPPKYDMCNIISPVALYYGNNDWAATEKDVLRTAAALPNVVSKKLVQDFNHLDFLWAIDAVSLLYTDVLNLMKKY